VKRGRGSRSDAYRKERKSFVGKPSGGKRKEYRCCKIKKISGFATQWGGRRMLTPQSFNFGGKVMGGLGAQ